MFSASIISATSLYVLAAVKTAPPSNDHVKGSVPASSTTVAPTLAPLPATNCCKAATSALKSRPAGAATAAIGVGPARDWPADALIRVSLAEVATDVVTCRVARAATIHGEATSATITSVNIAAARRPMPDSVWSAAGRVLGDTCGVAEES